MDWLNPYTLQVLTFLLLNLVMAISIYVTLATGQLSLGQAGFMSIGAYTASILTKTFDVPLSLALLGSLLVAGLVALVIGWPTLRLQGLYLAIATLGFGEVVRVILLNLKITNGALGITGIQSLSNRVYDLEKALGLSAQNLGVSVTQIKSLSAFTTLLLLFLVIVFFTYRLNQSRIGRAFGAIRADETAALAMGLNITHYKMLSFVIGSMLAGLGGGLYAHLTTAITPDDFSYHRAVEILSFAVIGGMEVVVGPLFGATLLTLMPEFFRVLSDYKLLLYGALMVLVMAFRPQGLITADLLRIRRKSSANGKEVR